ncbi:MAG: head GIN domain-containing protein [Flavobacteriales bacterium]|jgi:hypothetical protein|nr:head GIN domain-containing protein [Flavobacteriales bacterium]
MKRISSIIVLILFVATAIAQNTEERTLKHFTKIKAYGPVNITLHKSDRERVKVRAEGMETHDVRTEVSGLTLRIKLKGDIFEEKTVNVDLYYTELSELFVAAGADISSAEPLDGKNLTLHANSGAIMELEFASGSIDVNVSEGAIAELLGGVEYMEARVATGGILKGYNLAADNVAVRANTGGVAKVEADKSLEIHSFLGGVVHYRGNPEELSTDVTVGGVIRKD